MSETESQSSEDDASSVATDGSQSSMTGDSETEEEEGADPWMPMVEEAMQKHKTAFQEMKMNLTQSGLDEETAGEQLTLIFCLSSKRNWKVSICSVSN